jgi:carboxypeptidase family protein
MRLLLAVVLAVVSVGPVAAQTDTGEISGVVRDIQGGVLPGVSIVAEHLESGTRIERVTDGEGRYFLASLRTGIYTITAELSGFRRTIRSGLPLRLGQMLAIDFELEAGGITEEIVVTAEQPLLRSNAEISDVIENRQVVQVPLNGRNFLALAQLSDGVVLPPGGTRGDALQQAGPLPNVGGQRSGHNIYLLDGFKVTDELFNNLVINPSVDSIQEFKIQKSQYPAEFGGKASALINVATRTGTNTLHANVFDFGRHNRFDARNYFAPQDQPVPPLRQNQFGGTIGGPIKRNSTFFFGSYEGQRIRRSLTRTFSVPSAAARAGDFGSFRIPQSQIDPIATAFLEHVPLPNAPGESQNLTATGLQINNVDQVSVRIDQRLGVTDQLFGRFSTFDANDHQPFGTGALQETLVPGFGRDVTTTARNIGISHTHVFSTKVMNELRAGWLRVVGGQVSVNRGSDFAGQVGLQGVTRDPRDTGFPQVSTAGLYSTMGDPTSFTYRRNEHLELYENVLIDRGAHHVKFGGYLFHLKFAPEQPDNARGAFSYTGQFTGNAFADFLLGYPTSAVSGIGRGGEDARTTWLHLFAQDDWRVRSNLTVNAGLRYEFNQHMHDVGNRLSSVDVAGRRFVIASDDSGTISDEARALLVLMPLPYVSSEEAGWSRGLLRPSRVRLAPRTGFALALDNDHLVVRGGYGIFLNQWAYSVQTAFARNLPFFFSKEVAVPSDVRVPAFQTRDILTRDPTAVISPSIMDHDYTVEYTQTWSGGAQYELMPETVVETNYMGSWTVGADNATVRNVPDPGPGSIQARRPIPQLGAIRAIRFDGRSIYHAATFSAVRRLHDNYAYNVSYTLSISRDDASNPGPTESEANVPQNVRNIFTEAGEWARSSFDHRHVFTASATYQLPSLRGIAAVVGAWRINGVFLAQSGAPFTVNLGVDQANIGAGPAQRPDQIHGPNLPAGQRTPERWFDATAFALPAPFTFGSAPRNSVIGPGFSTTDLSVARTWSVSGSRELEVRWEIFNLFNKANFDLPSRIFGTPNFGRIFSAKDPREMQFGVKLNF